MTSNGRQQTSQSVVNRWLDTLVSIASSNDWPQNGHWISANSCMLIIYPDNAEPPTAKFLFLMGSRAGVSPAIGPRLSFWGLQFRQI
jgi:hypothetical protein